MIELHRSGRVKMWVEGEGGDGVRRGKKRE